MKSLIQRHLLSKNASCFVNFSLPYPTICSLIPQVINRVLIVIDDNDKFIGTITEDEIEKVRTSPFLIPKKELKAIDICNKSIPTISVDELSNLEIDASLFISKSQSFIIVLDEHYRVNSIIFDNLYSDIITKKALNYLKEIVTEKRILIYGTGCDSIQLYNRLLLEKINVDYFIDSKNFNGLFQKKKVLHYQDLVFENLKEIFIIFASSLEEYAQIKDEFIDFGLIPDVNFTYFRDIPPYESPVIFDATLSYGRKKSEIEGFEIFKNTDDNSAMKIFILGASTTESIYRLEKSWSYYILDIFTKNRIPVQIYCGGIIGYSSNQELLKLIRDVIPQKPQIVLLFDGYADIFRHPDIISFCDERRNKPFITEYQVEFLNCLLKKFPQEHRDVLYGLANKKSPSEFWFDNVRMMNAICKEFNIYFKSFIQPFYFLNKTPLTQNQKRIFNRWWNANEPRPLWCSEERINYINSEINNMIKLSYNTDYIVDLTKIFNKTEDVYFDYVHVYEKGNKIIAKTIFDNIKDIFIRK